MDDEPAVQPFFATKRKWLAVGFGALALLAGWIGTTAVRRAVRAHSPSPAHPTHTYAPPFGVQRSAVARVDLARVHRELFPRWVLAESEASGSATAAARLTELRAEAGTDPNLAALLTGLAKAASLAPGDERADTFTELVGDWNRYLDLAAAPWRIEPTVRSSKRGQTLYVKTYRVVSDVIANVGKAPCRARFLRREDHLNVIEPYLGRTTSREEGALIVLDRIRELGETQVWHLLDPANDPWLAATELPFAASVRGEASRALPGEAFRALHATAEAWLRLVRLVREVDARAKCGSDFHLGEPPTAGFSEATLERARLAVAADGSPCPSLTETELSAIWAASRTLAQEPALGLALDALTTWLARAVATHELRHAADGGLDGFATPCPACPTSLGPTGRAELSAYVTALATDGVAYVSIYQACTGALVGPSREAVRVVASALLPHGCVGEPPDDLVLRAGAAEERWFRRREQVVWTAQPLVSPAPGE